MFMRNSLFVFFILLLSFSCRDKIACPAFQSTYILDDSTRMAYYNYAWKLDEETRQQFLASAYGDGDSLAAGSSGTLRYYDYVEDIIQPREQVRRSKYGIIKYEPMWLKNYKLKSAPKENVLGPGPEEKDVAVPIDVGEFMASDFTDSLATDSTMARRDTLVLARSEPEVPRKKEVKYLYRYDPDSLNNAEQEYYNKYFGELLIDYAAQRKEQQDRLNMAAAKQQAASSSSAASDSTQVEGSKKRFSIRKSKDQNQSTATEPENEETTTDPEEKQEEGGGNE